MGGDTGSDLEAIQSSGHPRDAICLFHMVHTVDWIAVRPVYHDRVEARRGV